MGRVTGLVLGLDGGGTKTVAAVADADGRVLALGRGGASNPAFVARAEAERAVRQAVAAAVASAGIDAMDVIGLTACLSGPLPLAEILQELVPRAEVRVVPEWEVCLASAYERERGAVVLSGTGAFEWAIGPGGSMHADGFGTLLGDEGSAYWLALEGFRAVGRALDGRGPATSLARDLGPLARSLYRQGHSLARHEVADAAPSVTRAAAQGDAVALAVCRLAAQRLLRGLRLCLRRAGLEDGRPVTVALCGSVLRDAAPVREPLCAALGRLTPEARPVVPVLDPVRGALVLALADTGREVDAGVRGRLEASMTDRVLTAMSQSQGEDRKR